MSRLKIESTIYDTRRGEFSRRIVDAMEEEFGLVAGTLASNRSAGRIPVIRAALAFCRDVIFPGLRMDLPVKWKWDHRAHRRATRTPATIAVFQRAVTAGIRSLNTYETSITPLDELVDEARLRLFRVQAIQDPSQRSKGKSR